MVHFQFMRRWDITSAVNFEKIFFPLYESEFPKFFDRESNFPRIKKSISGRGFRFWGFFHPEINSTRYYLPIIIFLIVPKCLIIYPNNKNIFFPNDR